jgi:hypothetical protein
MASGDYEAVEQFGLIDLCIELVRLKACFLERAAPSRPIDTKPCRWSDALSPARIHPPGGYPMFVARSGKCSPICRLFRQAR